MHAPPLLAATERAAGPLTQRALQVLQLGVARRQRRLPLGHVALQRRAPGLRSSKLLGQAHPRGAAAGGCLQPAVGAQPLQLHLHLGLHAPPAGGSNMQAAGGCGRQATSPRDPPGGCMQTHSCSLIC